VIIPPEIILNSIDDFSILFFKDTTQDFNAPPHFWVIFPVSPVLKFSISIITSQVEKRKSYYSRTNTKALKALVEIGNDIFSFLDRGKKSIIDCNRMELLSKEELKRRIDPSGPCEIKTVNEKFPPFLKKNIFGAINQSPLIPPDIKKAIKNIHKDHMT
jgi:hypothetical protein